MRQSTGLLIRGPGRRAAERLYSPATALVAVQRWNLSDAQRAKLRDRMMEIAEGADPDKAAMATRVILAMDALDARRDKDEREADREDARLVLDAHAAALADPRYLDAISNVPPPQRQLPAPADTGEQPNT